MDFELNPTINAVNLAGAFCKRGRLQVRDLLSPVVAEAILTELTKLPWGLVFNNEEEVIELDAEAVAKLTREESRQIRSGILERARTGYQFLYGQYPLCRKYFELPRQSNVLFDLYDFINSAEFLDFVRTLTGKPSIQWADATATMFGAGHFLKGHRDSSPEHGRVAAYVLNFTKGWGIDWGGYLQFFNEHHDIEEAYRPVFNAINVFQIPVDHSVAMVAPYAPAKRYSITGWFREDRPPKFSGDRAD